MLPFTREQFFEVFRLYNEDVWPAQAALYVVGLIGLAGRFATEPIARIATMASLAVLWLWMGIAYHFTYFAAINPVARSFGVLSGVGAILFAWRAWTAVPTTPVRLGRAEGLFGALLIGYSLVGYTMVGLAFGHTYPAAPGFGLPCPTTIYTIGVLTFVAPPGRRATLVVPILWAGIGSTAAFMLGVPEDYGLVVAGAWGLWLLGTALRKRAG